ncbi:MAG: malate dehydrogenase [Candidatus Omnitrophica bacterium]|nr:malate dehydrogenase [Candidatus Omnitrophota bacterium]
MKNKVPKISIIGAGSVGGLTALRIAEKNLGRVVLFDIVPGLAKGKALDIEDCQQILKTNYSIEGTNQIHLLEKSDIVVVTAGFPRKPGMTREELLHKNAAIIKEICSQIKSFAPEAIVIIVTNPLDVMTYYALKLLGFSRQRVFGMGATLDGSRFATAISNRLTVPASSIKPLVIASHGEAMLPLPNFTLVKGKPLTKIVKDKKIIDELVKKTVERGKEIVDLLGSGSAFAAPSAAIAELVEIICRKKSAKVTVSCLLDGEYNLKDICLGVPVVLTSQGIKKIIELKLNYKEQKKLLESAHTIKSLITHLGV